MQDRLTVFEPAFRLEPTSGMLLTRIPVAGIHLDINKHALSDGGHREIGVTWTYSCPFTGAPRTMLEVYGTVIDVTNITRNFALANDPTPEARAIIFAS